MDSPRCDAELEKEEGRREGGWERIVCVYKNNAVQKKAKDTN
jgi:hypothetical protein